MAYKQLILLRQDLQLPKGKAAAQAAHAAVEAVLRSEKDVVKAWRQEGMAKIVLCDMRDDSPTKGEVNEFFVGEKNPILIRIPVGVAHGMKAIGTEPAYMLNVPDRPYDYRDPDEFRIPPHDGQIPYDWSQKDG